MPPKRKSIRSTRGKPPQRYSEPPEEADDEHAAQKRKPGRPVKARAKTPSAAGRKPKMQDKIVVISDSEDDPAPEEPVKKPADQRSRRLMEKKGIAVEEEDDHEADKQAEESEDGGEEDEEEEYLPFPNLTSQGRGRPGKTETQKSTGKPIAEKPPKQVASSSGHGRQGKSVKQKKVHDVYEMPSSTPQVGTSTPQVGTSDQAPSLGPSISPEATRAASVGLGILTTIATSAEMPSNPDEQPLDGRNEEQEDDNRRKRQRETDEEEATESSRKKRAITPPKEKEGEQTPEPNSELPTVATSAGDTSGNVGQEQEMEIVGGRRRSQRLRQSVASDRTETEPASKDASHSHRKRKASSQDPGEDPLIDEEQEIEVPDDLLEAALAPWGEGELLETRGWTELESDPVSLCDIIKSWGVTGVTVRDLPIFDRDEFKKLPQPVYGLVLLETYTPGAPEEVDKQGVTPWFATQLSLLAQNACGSYALLNILMNAEGVSLGEKLEQFKEETKNLDRHQRGYEVSSNAWLRSTHNVYSRRLDLMRESLHIQTESEKSKRPQSRRKKSKSTGDAQSAGYHYIGFVPIGNSVWHLDGLRTEGPVHVGTFQSGEDWYTVVEPWMTQRLNEGAEGDEFISVVALCGNEDPVEAIRVQLATNIRCLYELHMRWHRPDDARWAKLSEEILKGIDHDSMIYWDASKRTSEFGLDQNKINRLANPEEVANISNVDDMGTAVKMLRDYSLAQIDLQERYWIAEVGQEVPNDEGTASERTEDFTPFIHEFLKQLDKHYPIVKDLYEDLEREDWERQHA